MSGGDLKKEWLELRDSVLGNVTQLVGSDTAFAALANDAWIPWKICASFIFISIFLFFSLNLSPTINDLPLKGFSWRVLRTCTCIWSGWPSIPKFDMAFSTLYCPLEVDHWWFCGLGFTTNGYRANGGTHEYYTWTSPTNQCIYIYHSIDMWYIHIWCVIIELYHDDCM